MPHKHSDPKAKAPQKRHEPGRTGGKAEGDESDVPEQAQGRDRISGPNAAEREHEHHAEPKRTPGKAEG